MTMEDTIKDFLKQIVNKLDREMRGRSSLLLNRKHNNNHYQDNNKDLILSSNF